MSADRVICSHPPLGGSADPVSSVQTDVEGGDAGAVVSTFQVGAAPEPIEPRPGAPASFQPGVSLAICTRGRDASVNRLLDSVAAQRRTPDAVIVIDGSADRKTEHSVRARRDLASLAGRFLYVRVAERWRGSARQRNYALGLVRTDLVAFFDDDVVLLPGCLEALETVHRRSSEEIAGVGASLRNQAMRPTLLARLSRTLGMVSTLQPGSYARSGIAIPWEFLEDTREFVEGDWLYTTAAMWKTAIARETGFWDFDGYSLGEDVEFSLRARRYGKVGVAGAAGVLHLHDSASRPDPLALGYMEIFNRYEIHRRGLPDRSRADVLRFAYAWALDTVLLARDLRFRGRKKSTLIRMCGRLKGACDAFRGDRTASIAP